MAPHKLMIKNYKLDLKRVCKRVLKNICWETKCLAFCNALHKRNQQQAARKLNTCPHLFPLAKMNNNCYNSNKASILSNIKMPPCHKLLRKWQQFWNYSDLIISVSNGFNSKLSSAGVTAGAVVVVVVDVLLGVSELTMALLRPSTMCTLFDL